MIPSTVWPRYQIQPEPITFLSFGASPMMRIARMNSSLSRCVSEDLPTF